MLQAANVTPAAGMLRMGRKEARELLLYGLGLGTLADWLIWHHGPAVSGFMVWVVVVAIAVCVQAWRRKTLNLPFALAWSAVACLAAAVMVLRDSPVLNLAMGLLLLIASCMIALRLVGCDLQELRITALLSSALHTVASCLCGILPPLYSADLKSMSRHHQFYAALRAVLILLPLLILFLALFSSADAVFNAYTSQAMSWLGEDLAAHLVRYLVFIWISTGLFALLAYPRDRQALPDGVNLKLSPLETHIVLGGLSALFTLFVVLQLSYLFGGRNFIVSAWDITVADYARKGFFELLVVAGASIAMLLVLAPESQHQNQGQDQDQDQNQNQNQDKKKSRHYFQYYALIIIGCVLVMQASAMQRLLIYIAEFGLTFDRVIACAVLIWLCIVLLLLAWANLRLNYRGFLYNSICSGVAVLLICALLNPAALVVRVNLERLERMGELDTQYLLQLGPDAMLPLMEAFDSLPASARVAVAAAYQQHRSGWQLEQDWRHFNFARWRLLTI